MWLGGATREAPLLPGIDEEFWRAIRELPRRQAQCVALRYLEDRTVAEVASILGITSSTVRVHMHFAWSTLAERFDDTLSEEEA